MSDQGTNFECKAFESYCREVGVRKVRTTSYHPQCNGLAERTIKTVKQMLSGYVSNAHDNWDELLSAVTFAYNNAVHDSTRYAPNQLVYNQLLPSPVDRSMNIAPPQVTKERSEIESEVRERIGRAQAKQNKQYEHKVRDRVVFEPGDLVMLVNSRQTKGHVRSFEPKYIGPYRVLDKVNVPN